MPDFLCQNSPLMGIKENAVEAWHELQQCLEDLQKQVVHAKELLVQALEPAPDLPVAAAARLRRLQRENVILRDRVAELEQGPKSQSRRNGLEPLSGSVTSGRGKTPRRRGQPAGSRRRGGMLGRPSAQQTACSVDCEMTAGDAELVGGNPPSQSPLPAAFAEEHQTTSTAVPHSPDAAQLAVCVAAQCGPELLTVAQSTLDQNVAAAATYCSLQGSSISLQSYMIMQKNTPSKSTDEGRAGLQNSQADAAVSVDEKDAGIIKNRVDSQMGETQGAEIQVMEGEEFSDQQSLASMDTLIWNEKEEQIEADTQPLPVIDVEKSVIEELDNNLSYRYSDVGSISVDQSGQKMNEYSEIVVRAPEFIFTEVACPHQVDNDMNGILFHGELCTSCIVDTENMCDLTGKGEITRELKKNIPKNYVEGMEVLSILNVEENISLETPSSMTQRISVHTRNDPMNISESETISEIEKYITDTQPCHIHANREGETLSQIERYIADSDPLHSCNKWGEIGGILTGTEPPPHESNKLEDISEIEKILTDTEQLSTMHNEEVRTLSEPKESIHDIEPSPASAAKENVGISVIPECFVVIKRLTMDENHNDIIKIKADKINRTILNHTKSLTADDTSCSTDSPIQSDEGKEPQQNRSAPNRQDASHEEDAELQSERPLQYMKYVKGKGVALLHNTSAPGRKINKKFRLLCAAAAGKSVIVGRLLMDGISPDVTDRQGCTALHHAAQNGHVRVLCRLITAGADPTTHCHSGRTALHHAVEGGNTEAAYFLLRSGVKCHHRDKSGETPVQLALRLGRVQLFRRMVTKTNHVLNDTLLRSAQRGCVEMCRRLLEKGAHPWFRGSGGRTALHEATAAGYVSVVKLLLRGGARVRAVDGDGRSAMHVAARRGSAQLVELLVHSGADPSLRDAHRRTPLHLAAERGHSAAVRALLVAGASVRHRDSTHHTALGLAAAAGYVEVCRCLLEAGALKYEKKSPDPALHASAAAGHTSVVQLLLEAHALPSALDLAGFSPLHLAAERGHECVVRILLSCGADPCLCDSDGNIPAQLAKTDALRQLLLKAVLAPSSASAAVDGDRSHSKCWARQLIEWVSNDGWLRYPPTTHVARNTESRVYYNLSTNL